VSAEHGNLQVLLQVYLGVSDRPDPPKRQECENCDEQKDRQRDEQRSPQTPSVMGRIRHHQYPTFCRYWRGPPTQPTSENRRRLEPSGPPCRQRRSFPAASRNSRQALRSYP